MCWVTAKDGYITASHCLIWMWLLILALVLMPAHFNTVSKRGQLSFRSLQWRHNELDGVSSHQPHDCLLNCLFRRRSKKTSRLRVTGLCDGNSPVTGEFPAQKASNAENISIWCRHHIMKRKQQNFTRDTVYKPVILCTERGYFEKIVVFHSQMSSIYISSGQWQGFQAIKWYGMVDQYIKSRAIAKKIDTFSVNIWVVY